jgi:hypothetical protein
VPGNNEEVVAYLNRLAGTTGREMAGAANALAGTTGLEVAGALNVAAGTTGREMGYLLENLGAGGGEPADAYVDEITADNPVFYMPLNEATVDPTLEIGSFTPSVVGSGITSIADGPGGRRAYRMTAAGNINLADDAALDLTTFTYECWFRPSATQDTRRGLMAKGTGGGSGPIMFVAMNSHGAVEQSNTALLFSAPSAMTSTSTWYHVVVSYTPGNARFYINKTELSNAPTTNVTFPATTQPFTIGAQSINGSYFDRLHGDIAQVALYNTNLSSARVTAHYDAMVA